MELNKIDSSVNENKSNVLSWDKFQIRPLIYLMKTLNQNNLFHCGPNPVAGGTKDLKFSGP